MTTDNDNPRPEPGPDPFAHVRDEAAERGVLGALLVYSETARRDQTTAQDLAGAVDTLRADHFTTPIHRRAFAVLARKIRRGEGAELQDLAAAIVAEPGPPIDEGEALDAAQSFGRDPFALAQLPDRVSRLRDLAIRRAVGTVAQRTLLQAQGGDVDAGALLDTLQAAAEGEPVDLARFTVRAVVDRFVGRLRRRGTAGEVARYPWPGDPDDGDDDERGYPDGALLPADDGTGAAHRGPSKPWRQLHRIAGPLTRDRLAVLVGATGRGKSGFALQVAESAARAGQPVLYVSAEMGADELAARLLALRARGDRAYRAVLHGRIRADEVETAGRILEGECPRLYLWDPPSGERNAPGVLGMARAVSKACDDAPPLVVIDYLQRLAEGQEIRIAVRDISAALRDLTRPGGLGRRWPGAAVLALSSTGRGNYAALSSVENLEEAAAGRKVPKGDSNGKIVNLEGLGKESGELETDASLLLVMTTDRVADGDPPGKERPGLVAVVKNRHGGTGRAHFTFYPRSGRFEERDPDEAAGDASGGKGTAGDGEPGLWADLEQ